jgi:hypothetical protein
MIRRRKTLVLCLLSICLISGVIVYKNNQPKNIFEEIYHAEMHAAWWKENTPLSNTEYFKYAVAGYIEYSEGKLTSSTAKEVQKDDSLYTLAATYLTYRGDGDHPR